MLFSKHEEVEGLKGVIFCSLGKLVGGLGGKNPEIYPKFYQEIHNLVLETIVNETKDKTEYGDFETIEGCYNYLSECTEALGESFAKEVLPKIWPQLEKILSFSNVADPSDWQDAMGEAPTLDEDEPEGYIVLPSLSIAQSQAVHYLASCASFAANTFKPY